ncbi:MAG: spermidine synthase [Betaproteobacteria bacterium]
MRLAAVCLAVLSGAAGLTWQSLWSIELSTALGHEWVATLGVMAGMFLGMSVGAGGLGPVANRSRRPGLWFAGLEALIGLWGLLTAISIPFLLPLISRSLGEQPSSLQHALWAFVLPCVALIPSTAAMGASLPALIRATADERNGLEFLYGANTAGAMAAVALTAFLLVPNLGIQRTALLATAANLACAVAASWLWRRRAISETGSPAHGESLSMNTSPKSGRAHALLVLALTGFLGIGYETLCIRALSQVTENTVYTYAVLLCVFLGGTAAGSFLHSKLAAAFGKRPWLLLMTTAMAVTLGCVTLWWVDILAGTHTNTPATESGTISTEIALALTAMLLPAVCMGASFTSLCHWARDRGASLGASFAANTAGSALAPAVVGVLAIAQLGMAQTAGALMAAYTLAVMLVHESERRMKLAQFATFAAAIGAIAVTTLIAPPLRMIHLDGGARLRFYEDGAMAAVSVEEDGKGILRLRINNRVQEGSSAASPVETRLALVPMMMHPHPKRSLFLGWGTGYTAQVAGLDSGLAVDAVELLPEVVRASALFAQTPDFPKALRPARLVTADARRFALAGDGTYDLVVADLFHPARSGAGSLYTVEHFEALSRRLAPGGIVCQWLALHQLEWSTFRPILAAFREVFPQAVVVLATNSLETPVLGLIARPDAPFPTLQEVQQRIDDVRPQLGRQLDLSRLVDAHAVLGTLIAGPAETSRWVNGVTSNRDDLPLVAHLAPWDTYSPRTTSRQRLSTLLSEAGHLTPQSVRTALKWDTPTGSAGAEDAASVASYVEARNRYLRLGLVMPANLGQGEALDALGRELQLLLSTSPHFTPAIDALRSLRSAHSVSPPSH